MIEKGTFCNEHVQNWLNFHLVVITNLLLSWIKKYKRREQGVNFIDAPGSCIYFLLLAYILNF